MIRVANPRLGALERAYVLEALDAGEVSSKGSFVGRFEVDFARFCETEEAVAVSNGTVALHLALVGMGVGPGDEVIVPALTFVATANAVVHAGARPVFADVEATSWGIDPVEVAGHVTPATKAIIPVHLYGHPANMGALSGIAETHGLFLLEDAAEAHGARYRGRRVGGLGDAATFSFFGNKILTMGEGGAITTNSGALAERLRQLRDHGADPTRQYWHAVVGYNYRLANLQAALGVAQLEQAEDVLRQKHAIAARYRTALDGLPLTFQPRAPWAEPVDWMVTVVLSSEFPSTVTTLAEYLASHGIETRRVFHPLPDLPLFESQGSFPVAAGIAERGLCLPSGPDIRDSQIDTVTDAIRQFFREPPKHTPSGSK